MKVRWNITFGYWYGVSKPYDYSKEANTLHKRFYNRLLAIAYAKTEKLGSFQVALISMRNKLSQTLLDSKDSDYSMYSKRIKLRSYRFRKSVLSLGYGSSQQYQRMNINPLYFKSSEVIFICFFV